MGPYMLDNINYTHNQCGLLTTSRLSISDWQDITKKLSYFGFATAFQ